MQARIDLVEKRGSQFVIRGRGVDRVITSLALSVLLGVCFCGCVKVTTGATSEEAISISQDVASRIRAEWAQETRNASPSQRVRMLHSLCIKVAGSYIGIGYQAVEKWRNMEDINGDEVADTDVKRMLDDWILTEQPVFKAYDDNIRYTLQEIASSGYFEDDVLEPLETLVMQYEKVAMIAFNPTGSPGDYEYVLEQLEYETESVSARVKEALKAL